MKILKSNKFWIGVIAAVLAVCGIVAGVLYWQKTHQAPAEEGPIAVIRLDGKIVAAVDLGKVTESYTQTFEGASGGSNTVEFAPGQVRVHDATCPDQICVSQGWADGATLLPIACLPNSLIIEVASPEDLGLDSVSR